MLAFRKDHTSKDAAVYSRKTLFVILACLSAGFLFFHFTYLPNHQESVYRDLAITTEQPLVFFNGDPRSRTVNRFVSSIREYNQEHNLGLFFAFHSHAEIDFTLLGDHEQRYHPRLNYPQNTYHLFLGGKSYSEGSLFQDPKALKNHLRQHFHILPTIDISAYFAKGTSVKDLVIGKSLEGRYEAYHRNIFIFSEKICHTCDSGNLLAMAEEEWKAGRVGHIAFLIIRPIEDQQINVFRQANKVSIPIYSADVDLIEYWQEMKRDYDGWPRNPLEGAALVVDQKGTIIDLVMREDLSSYWLTHRARSDRAIN
jgi:ribosomal protein S27AE